MRILKHLILILLISISIYANSPPIFSYQGYLTDINGNPVIGDKSVTFSIYNTANETTPLWQEIHLITPDQFGQFTVLLGSQHELNNSIFDGQVKFIGIKIENNQEMLPRQQINSVPYAINSNISDNSITTDKIIDNTILLSDINQNEATTGQVIKWDGSAWVVADDLSGSDNQGIIITVIAGDGLTGGGNSDTITLAVDTESISSSMIQNNSITDEDINSNAQIDISKISNAASLQNEQIFYGNNTFNQSLDIFQGTTQNYALKAENNYGGFGIVCKTNSDTIPALKVITGITEPAQIGEPNGTGPLIEAWSTTVTISPPETIVNKRFVVENNGDVFADGAFTGGGADFAELIEVSDDNLKYETGDLLIIDINNPKQFKLSSSSNSSLVAGVYSPNPGFIGYDKDYNYNVTIPMAIVGIVLCKVTNTNGSIDIGDLLVSSNLDGHAMKGISPQIGTVIGKALEASEINSDLIKILLTLQ